MTPRRVDVLGVGVDAQTLDDAVDRIGGWVERGEPNYVCVTGVHGVIASQDDADLRRIHNEAGMVTTDGMPLVWLCRSSLRDGRGRPRVERVYGPDLMQRAFERSEVAGWRHFLFGSSPATLDRLAVRLRARFPRARVVGAHSPPYGPIEPGGPRDRAAGDAIARAHPDIVWVGLGTPKQERWMAAHVGRVGAPVLVGVGAAFDFLAGTKPQAPSWMRHAGLEWAFRMAHEPRRLAGRYLRSNPRFVALVARQVLGKHGTTWNDVD
jgi:N-acetylglucosaminyldiphosphoundecaprenol N-acetyl-beta-D-mannosaminyltransferase